MYLSINEELGVDLVVLIAGGPGLLYVWVGCGETSGPIYYHSGRWTENYKKKFGEHKVITPKKQYLGIIFYGFLCI